MHIGDLPGELRRAIVRSCVEREPSTLGILVHGSYATGTARPDSDLDLDVFLSAEPTTHYRTWFENRSGEPLHVSARSDFSLQVWESEQREPAGWAYGMPVEMHHAWLWSADRELRERLGEHPVRRQPATAAEVEDLVEAFGKLRRARADGDELGLRLAASAIARSAAACVIAVNDPAPVADPRAALAGLLELPTAPQEWAGDVLECLGLTGADAAAIDAAAERLVPGVLRLLRSTDPYADPQPDVARYLLDGTWERRCR